MGRHWFEDSNRRFPWHELFAPIPRDPRAAAEFARFHLAGPPYAGPELVVPAQTGPAAGNSGRHLPPDRDARQPESR